MRASTSLAAFAALGCSSISALAQPCRDEGLYHRPESGRIPAPHRHHDRISGQYRFVGYNDMAEMMGALAAAFTDLQPGVRFDLELRGTRTGPPAMIAGAALLAPMGAEWDQSDLDAYRRIHGHEPIMFRIAHASLDPAALSSPTAVVVHAASPIDRITVDQLRAIFVAGGGVVDWAQVNPGASGEIHPVGLAPATAIAKHWRRYLFNGSNYTSSLIGKAQSRAVIEAVAADPLAIGLANLNHVKSGVKALGISIDGAQQPVFGNPETIRNGTYPLDRHLLIYVGRDRQGQIDPVARAFLDFALSCEGQAIIGQGSRGYLPLSPGEVGRERRKLHSFKANRGNSTN